VEVLRVESLRPPDRPGAKKEGKTEKTVRVRGWWKIILYSVSLELRTLDDRLLSYSRGSVLLEFGVTDFCHPVLILARHIVWALQYSYSTGLVRLIPGILLIIYIILL
jgi:hypothetical protein